MSLSVGHARHNAGALCPPVSRTLLKSLTVPETTMDLLFSGAVWHWVYRECWCHILDQFGSRTSGADDQCRE